MQKKSIFAPLIENDLTSLKIQYDFKTDAIKMWAAKEYEKDQDFSRYNTDFYAESILTEDAKFLNTKEVYALYDASGLGDYLREYIERIREGKHFGIEAYYNYRYDMGFVENQHSRRKGLKNHMRTFFDGGIRRHTHEEDELACLQDGLNLGRAMSYKNFPADVPVGGAKAVLISDPVDLDNMDQMGWFAYCIDKCKAATTPDMYLPPEMVGVINEHFSEQWLTGTNSRMGSSAIPTAIGVYEAMKVGYKFKTGETLEGKTVAVQGLGGVGYKVASLLAEDGISIIVTDINEARIEQLKKEFPDADITAVGADEILTVKCDVLCPCAMGGVISEELIPELQTNVIVGAANNQLKGVSAEDERKVAQALKDAGIQYQQDFVNNCGGVICALYEYEEAENADFDVMIKRVKDKVSSFSLKLLEDAEEKGVTTTDMIYDICEAYLYGDLDYKDL